MKAPLISISFGSSAIFLIGSNNKHTKPKAIIINSGDLVIMSNESRAAFHAVPKIFKASNLENYLNYANSEEAAKNRHTFVDDYEWRDYFDYIKINRINLNIRQVFD